MDETLVRLDEIGTRDEVHSLTFRDLTIDCGNDYFTDLRCDNPVTIRLERFVGPFNSIFDANSRATYHFERCDFTDMSVWVKRSVERQTDGVRFVDCRFRYLPDDYQPPGGPKPVSRINPAWK